MARVIRESAHLSAEQIESVTIHASTHAQLHCGWEYAPTGVTAAQMSIPYGVASMLAYGDVSANRFTEEAIAAPDTVALARRVSVQPDEAIDALGPELRYTIRFELRTKNGEVFTGEAADRPGGPTTTALRGRGPCKVLRADRPVVGRRARPGTARCGGPAERAAPMSARSSRC